jgi:hypothetical protein
MEISRVFKSNICIRSSTDDESEDVNVDERLVPMEVETDENEDEDEDEDEEKLEP